MIVFRRLLFLSIGFIIGACAGHYLTGWYSIIFQAFLWTSLIFLIIGKNRKIKNDKLGGR